MHYLGSDRLEGDDECGVLDGRFSTGNRDELRLFGTLASPFGATDGLMGALKAAPAAAGTLFQHFTQQQFEESFNLIGSRRMAGLPPPRPRLKRAAERKKVRALFTPSLCRIR